MRGELDSQENPRLLPPMRGQEYITDTYSLNINGVELITDATGLQIRILPNA
jgi:hypothetical protein